jgi:hypothetical protein
MLTEKLSTSTVIYTTGCNKMWDHKMEVEEYRLLECGALYILCEPTFLRNVGSHKVYKAPHLRRRHSS